MWLPCRVCVPATDRDSRPAWPPSSLAAPGSWRRALGCTTRGGCGVGHRVISPACREDDLSTGQGTTRSKKRKSNYLPATSPGAASGVDMDNNTADGRKGPVDQPSARILPAAVWESRWWQRVVNEPDSPWLSGGENVPGIRSVMACVPSAVASPDGPPEMVPVLTACSMRAA